MARSSYAGLGVFKSEDAGKTWQHMGLEGTYHVPRVVIDPENPEIVYVAALGHNYTYNDERGVYKTTDGGKNRERLSNGIPVGDYVGRFGLAIAPTNPDVLYAILDNQKPDSTQRRGKVGGELYRSDDKGESWVKTHTGPFPTNIGYDFCLVRVSPDNEDEVFVPAWKLIHSKDGGKTFEYTGDTIVHILSHDIRVMHLDMHEMWIDPMNPDRLLLGNDGGLYCCSHEFILAS
ncbi:hypothetical protein ES708_27691 [subsurface metagenome]